MSQRPPAPDLHVLCTQPDGSVSTIRDGRKVHWTPERPIRQLPFDSAMDLVRLGINFVALFAVDVLAARYKVPVSAVEALIKAGKASTHEYKDADAPEGAKPTVLVALTAEVARALGADLKAKAKAELRKLREKAKAAIAPKHDEAGQ